MSDRYYSYIPNWFLDDGTMNQMSRSEIVLIPVIARKAYKWRWSGEVTNHELSSMSGLKIRSVQMAMKSLSDRGVIERDGRRFRFLNPDGLKSRPGFVYAIRSESGAIKVGFSTKSPESRVGQMQTGTAEALELIGFVPGTHDDEQACHRVLKDFGYHIRGEWFEDGKWSGVFAAGILADGKSVVDEVDAGIARMMASKSGWQT